MSSLRKFLDAVEWFSLSSMATSCFFVGDDEQDDDSLTQLRLSNLKQSLSDSLKSSIFRFLQSCFSWYSLLEERDSSDNAFPSIFFLS